MPSTIVWFTLAVMAGAVVGLALGHWSAVSARWARWLEDPVSSGDGRQTGGRRQPARRATRSSSAS